MKMITIIQRCVRQKASITAKSDALEFAGSGSSQVTFSKWHLQGSHVVVSLVCEVIHSGQQRER